MLICRLVGVNEEIKTSALAGALGGWVAFNVYTDCSFNLLFIQIGNITSRTSAAGQFVIALGLLVF